MQFTAKLAQDIINYLGTRPFCEVADLMARIHAEYQAQQPKPDDKPAEPGTGGDMSRADALNKDSK